MKKEKIKLEMFFDSTAYIRYLTEIKRVNKN